MRDGRFDNLKGFLIVLVVIGHAFALFRNEKMEIIQTINIVIASFHMPAFVFVAGFFSKKALQSDDYSYKQVKNVLIPFLMAHLLMWLITSHSIDTLLYPAWSLWFLLSLFFWRMLVVPVSKIRYSIVFTLVIAVLIGFSTADQVLSISKTTTFFPYFLAGYFMSFENIDKLRNIKSVVPVIGLLSVFAVVFIMGKNNLPVMNAFAMAAPYSSDLYDSCIQGLLLRVVSILIGFVAILCLLAIVPSRRTFFTDLGRNTITVYLGHSFCLKLIKRFIILSVPIILNNEMIVMFISLFLTAIICVMFGNQRVSNIYNKLIDKISKAVLRTHSC